MLEEIKIFIIHHQTFIFAVRGEPIRSRLSAELAEIGMGLVEIGM